MPACPGRACPVALKVDREGGVPGRSGLQGQAGPAADRPSSPGGRGHRLPVHAQQDGRRVSARCCQRQTAACRKIKPARRSVKLQQKGRQAPAAQQIGGRLQECEIIRQHCEQQARGIDAEGGKPRAMQAAMALLRTLRAQPGDMAATARRFARTPVRYSGVPGHQQCGGRCARRVMGRCSVDFMQASDLRRIGRGCRLLWGRRCHALPPWSTGLA